MRAVSERSRSKPSAAGIAKQARPAPSSVESASQNDGASGLAGKALRDRLRKATSTDGTFDVEEHVELIAREIERVRHMLTI